MSSDFWWLDQVSLDSSYEANIKRRKARISTPNKILLMWQLVPQEVAKVVRQIRGPHNKGMAAHCQTGGLPKITGSFPFKGGYWGHIGIMEKNMEATIYGLGFPKIRGTFLGVPIISFVVFWGTPYFGKLPSLFPMYDQDLAKESMFRRESPQGLESEVSGTVASMHEPRGSM